MSLIGFTNQPWDDNKKCLVNMSESTALSNANNSAIIINNNSKLVPEAKISEIASLDVPLSEFSTEQLRDVGDVLRRPLSGRAVMIPLGPKAFYSGTLCPNVIRENNGDLQECVKLAVKDDKTGLYRHEEMARQQARDYIQHEIDSRIPKKKIAVPPKSSLKPARKIPCATKNSIEQSQSSPAAAALSFFEIREEIDDSGNVVQAEAVNITKQLELIEKQTREKASPDSEYLQEVHESGNGDEPMLVNTSVPKPLSNSDYDKLTSRLDELARLEEEADQAKTDSLKSRQQIQSKGWCRGFLNGNRKKESKKERPPIKPQLQSPPVTHDSPSRSHANTNMTVDQPKRVSFDQASNQVREISQVGDQPIKDLHAVASSQPQPIEGDVFSGVVKERKSAVRRKKQSPQQQVSLPSQSTQKPQQKRVSKFSLERQQLHQV